jgi:hypothetical protein
MGAFHVKPFKCPPPTDTAIWASSMQIMSLRVGNANVVLPFTVHEEQYHQTYIYIYIYIIALSHFSQL